MKIINFTPHAVSVWGDDSAATGPVAVIPPSGLVARVTTRNIRVASLPGEGGEIPVYRQEIGAVEGLAAPVDGQWLLVSLVVRLALPTRTDLLSPGELRRGPDGQPRGCQGLVQNGGAA